MSEYDDLNIQYFKLSSGEQIISMVLDPSESDADIYPDEILLHKPMKLMLQIENDKEIYYFTPWQVLADNDACILYANHVITSAGCKVDIKEKYVKFCMVDNVSSVKDDQPELVEKSTQPGVIEFDSYKNTKH